MLTLYLMANSAEVMVIATNHHHHGERSTGPVLSPEQIYDHRAARGYDYSLPTKYRYDHHQDKKSTDPETDVMSTLEQQ